MKKMKKKKWYNCWWVHCWSEWENGIGRYHSFLLGEHDRDVQIRTCILCKKKEIRTYDD